MTQSAAPAAADLSRLDRERRGRNAFERMISSWITRSGWSFQVMSDLVELALTQVEAPGIAPAAVRDYVKGEVMIYRGHVWRARRDASLVAGPGGEPEGPWPKVKEEGTSDWEHLHVLRRIYPSQLNSITRGMVGVISAGTYDALGCLNEWLAGIRSGQVPSPTDPRLREKAEQALVIEDQDGVFGPEEFFSVGLGRLKPPISVTKLTAEEAAATSRQLAKAIRLGLMQAGMDILDDWPQFVSAYPSTDRERLGKVRDVALGRGSWSPEQVEDEEAAIAIALAKLKRKAERSQRQRSADS